jgi:hypothetical protein
MLEMARVVSAAPLAANNGVHIRIGTLLIALLVLVVIIGIIYGIWRSVSGGRKPPGDRQDGFSPRDR